MEPETTKEVEETAEEHTPEVAEMSAGLSSRGGVNM